MTTSSRMRSMRKTIVSMLSILVLFAASPVHASAALDSSSSSSSTLQHDPVVGPYYSVALTRGGGSRQLNARADEGHAHAQKLLRVRVPKKISQSSKYVLRDESAAPRPILATTVAATTTTTGTSVATKTLITTATTMDAAVGCPFSDFGVPVVIGGVTFSLLIDTGSSTLAIAGASCTTCAFTPLWKMGTVSVATSTMTRGEYGGGTGWVGRIYSDSVALGASASTTAIITPGITMNIAVVTAQSQNGFAANGAASASASPFFTPDYCADDTALQQTAVPYQGILGLAYQSIASGGTDSFAAQLFAQTPSMAKQFSMALCEHGGNMWIGGLPSSSYIGARLSVPITTVISPITKLPSASYYSVAQSNIMLNGVSLGLTAADFVGYYSAIDSGTTDWMMPTGVYNKIVAALYKNAAFLKYFSADVKGGNDFFNVNNGNCDAAKPQTTGGAAISPLTLQAELPTLSLQFANGVILTMDGVGSYLMPCDKTYHWFTSGISPYDSGSILGWPMMNQFTTTFDHGAGISALTGDIGSTVSFAVTTACTFGNGGLAPLKASVTNPSAPTAPVVVPTPVAPVIVTISSTGTSKSISSSSSTASSIVSSTASSSKSSSTAAASVASSTAAASVASSTASSFVVASSTAAAPVVASSTAAAAVAPVVPVPVVSSTAAPSSSAASSTTSIVVPTIVVAPSSTSSSSPSTSPVASSTAAGVTPTIVASSSASSVVPSPVVASSSSGASSSVVLTVPVVVASPTGANGGSLSTPTVVAASSSTASSSSSVSVAASSTASASSSSPAAASTAATVDTSTIVASSTAASTVVPASVVSSTASSSSVLPSTVVPSSTASPIVASSTAAAAAATPIVASSTAASVTPIVASSTASSTIATVVASSTAASVTPALVASSTAPALVSVPSSTVATIASVVSSTAAALIVSSTAAAKSSSTAAAVVVASSTAAARVSSSSTAAARVSSSSSSTGRASSSSSTGVASVIQPANSLPIALGAGAMNFALLSTSMTIPSPIIVGTTQLNVGAVTLTGTVGSSAAVNGIIVLPTSLTYTTAVAQGAAFFTLGRALLVGNAVRLTTVAGFTATPTGDPKTAYAAQGCDNTLWVNCGYVYSGAAMAMAASTAFNIDYNGVPNIYAAGFTRPQVFIVADSFTIGASVTFNLLNGALASDIFFVLSGSMTVGASTSLVGTFSMGVSVVFGASVTLQGRIIAGSAITFGATCVVNQALAKSSPSLMKITDMTAMLPSTTTTTTTTTSVVSISTASAKVAASSTAAAKVASSTAAAKVSSSSTAAKVSSSSTAAKLTVASALVVHAVHRSMDIMNVAAIVGNSPAPHTPAHSSASHPSPTVAPHPSAPTSSHHSSPPPPTAAPHPSAPAAARSSVAHHPTGAARPQPDADHARHDASSSGAHRAGMHQPTAAPSTNGPARGERPAVPRRRRPRDAGEGARHKSSTGSHHHPNGSTAHVQPAPLPAHANTVVHPSAPLPPPAHTMSTGPAHTSTPPQPTHH